MPRSLPQHALARRAVAEPRPSSHHGWLQRGVAALGVTVLGVGVAGSVVTTGSAEHLASSSLVSAAQRPSVSTSVEPGVTLPSAFTRRDAAISRAVTRPGLAVDQRADQRAAALSTAGERTRQTAQVQAVKVRQRSLSRAAVATKKQATEIKAAQKRAAAAERSRKAAAERSRKAQAERSRKAAVEKRGTKQASLPVTAGYRIAARFGDTGSWSRYHTGIDFSAPMGTPVHAIAAGEVTHAGSGSASWAGHYVTVRHADGKSTLYAHMSTVSVHVGEKVGGGDKVGAIGMTGRTFGPHVHVELYPSGVTPGDPYKAVNPAPWMSDRGLHP